MYLTGMLGQNLIYNIVATGLYFYFQNVICLPAMALGWIFALARVWEGADRGLGCCFLHRLGYVLYRV